MQQCDVTMTLRLTRKVNYTDAADLEKKLKQLSPGAAARSWLDGGSFTLWDLEDASTSADEGYPITPEDFTYDLGEDEDPDEDEKESGEVAARA